jgi:hypothetical protein
MSGVERTQRMLAMAREEQASPAARARMRAAIGAALALPAAIGTAGGGSASPSPPATAPATAAPITTAPVTAAPTATASATATAGGVATTTAGAFVAGAASGAVATMLLVLGTGFGAAPAVPARSGAGVHVAVASLSAVLAAERAPGAAAGAPGAASVGSLPSVTVAPREPLPEAGSSRAAGSPGGRAPADDAPRASAALGTTPGPASTPTLAEETAALRKAQRALSDGDPSGAMEVLKELSWRHPNGVLREERMVAEVAALCASGKRDAARAVADRLLAEQPSAVGAARVRASCAFAASER